MSREAFAAGYAEHGPLPLPPAAQAAYHATRELALPAAAVFEVGQVEGRRQALHKRRVKQQRTHAAAVVAVTAAFRTSVDAGALVHHLLPYTDQGRPAVRQAALDELDRQARMTDGIGAAWQQTNTDAYLIATAEGIAVASNSLDQGGPPSPAAVARDHPAALASVGGTLAWATADRWTTEQLGGLAGDVARAVGTGPAASTALDALPTAAPGCSLDEVVQAARDALDTAQGLGFYAEEQSASQAGLGFLLYLDQPGVLLDFVTMGDPRVEAVCQGYANDGPYLPGEVPDIPVHGLCRCWYETHQIPAALAA